MKQLYLLIAIICAAKDTFAQWQLSDSSINQSHYALDIKNSGKLFVGGEDSSSVSSNFGQYWNRFSNSVTGGNGSFNFPLIRDAFFFDDLNGCAPIVDLVSREVIGKTSDGGLTWTATRDTQITAGNNYALSAIHFPTPTVGYCVGYPNRIYKTTNGGNSWSLVFNNQQIYFNDVFFVNKDTGIAVGDYGFVRTLNGGSTWSLVGTQMNLTGVHVPADTIAYASSLNSQLYRIKLNTGSYTTLNLTTLTGVYNNYRDVFFTSADTGYIICDSVYRVLDQGQTYESCALPGSGTLRKIKFSNSMNGAIIANSKKIYTTGNAGGGYTPIVSITTPGNTYCQNIPYTFSAQGSLLWTYNWYVNNVFIGSGKTITYSFPSATFYTLKLVASNGAVSRTKSTVITVYSTETVTPFSISLIADTTCPGSRPANFTTNANYVDNTPVTITLNSNQSGATYSLYRYGTLLSNSFPYTHTPGSYIDDIIYYCVGRAGSSQCRYNYDTAYATQHVYPWPGLMTDLSLLEDTICLDQPVTIRLPQSLNSYNYQFAFSSNNYGSFIRGTGDTVQGTRPSNTWYYSSGTVTLNVHAVSDEGCEYFGTRNDFLRRDSMVANFDYDYENYLIGDTMTVDNKSIRGTHWLWRATAGTEFSDSSQFEPYIMFTDTGKKTVKLMASTNFGCKDTVSKNIYVHQSVDSAIAYTKCYRSELKMPGVDSFYHIILDQHIDRKGNLYTCGYYYSQDMGFYRTRYHLFVSKYDSIGTLEWERRCIYYNSGTYFNPPVYTQQDNFNTSSYYFSCATGVTTDEAGNIYISGTYTGQKLKLGNITVRGSLLSYGCNQGYIAKLDKDGNYQWAVSTNVGCSNNNVSLGNFFSDIEYVGNNRLVAAGMIGAYWNLNTDSATFTNGSHAFDGPVLIDTAGNYLQCYTLKETSGINKLYYYKFATLDGSIVSSDQFPYTPKLERTSDGVYVYGHYKTLDNNTTQLTSPFQGGYRNVGYFAGKIGSNGWQWLRDAGSTDKTRIVVTNTFTVDEAGDYYIMQDYLNHNSYWGYDTVAYFYPNTYVHVQQPTAFLSKFSGATGQLIWKKSFPTFGTEPGSNLSDQQIAFASGSIYLLLLFRDNFPGIYFNNGYSQSMHSLMYNVPVSINYTDKANGALVQFDLSGNAIAAIHAGRINGFDELPVMMDADFCHQDLYISGILLDDYRYPTITGNFSRSVYSEKLSLNGDCSTAFCNSKPAAANVITNYCSDTAEINYSTLLSDNELDSVSIDTAFAFHGNVSATMSHFYYSPLVSNTSDTIQYVACDPYNLCDTAYIFLSSQLPFVSLTGNPDMVCSNMNAFALMGGAPAGGVYSGTGVSNNTFDPAAAGLGAHLITYTYTDGNNCTNADTETIAVSICTSNAEILNDFPPLVYPNPAMNELYLSLDLECIRNYDTKGQLMLEVRHPLHRKIDISKFPPGIYIAELKIRDSVRRTRWVKL